jgi:hypothetical protein
MRRTIFFTVALLSLALLAVQQSFVPRPTTFREAVLTALDSHQVVYDDVIVSQSCLPDASACYSHSADVVVYAGQVIYGRVECRHYSRGCNLSLRDRALCVSRCPTW